MTYDVVALLDERPSRDDLLASMGAAGTELGIRAVSGGAVIQLCDDDGEPLVSIDTPIYVQVPGEPARLLGPELADVPHPVWWVEVRASAQEGAAQIAWRYTDHLVRRIGGQVWAPPPNGAPLSPPEPGTTDSRKESGNA